MVDQGKWWFDRQISNLFKVYDVFTDIIQPSKIDVSTIKNFGVDHTNKN